MCPWVLFFKNEKHSFLVLRKATLCHLVSFFFSEIVCECINMKKFSSFAGFSCFADVLRLRTLSLVI